MFVVRHYHYQQVIYLSISIQKQNNIDVQDFFIVFHTKAHLRFNFYLLQLKMDPCLFLVFSLQFFIFNI